MGKTPREIALRAMLKDLEKADSKILENEAAAYEVSAVIGQPEYYSKIDGALENLHEAIGMLKAYVQENYDD